MLSIKDLIIIEELDSDNLYWKVNMWFGRKDVDKIPFWKMMQEIIQTNTLTLDSLNILLDKYGISWRNFVQFAMDNVDGTQEFDQLYIMSKIVNILKNNKQLNWNLG